LRGFYSLSPRIWYGDALRKDLTRKTVDPYAPGQPDHRQRTKKTVREICGMTVETLGSPEVTAADQSRPTGARNEPAAIPQDTPPVVRTTKLSTYKPGLGRG